ncbi:unnamed protein product [Adineta steineri]|uniref:NACHT domain-containing protein n=1 Tax=Adineta steineri TaxID=433720 RepID=A0A814JZD9_9BILA|nr:unnamed protein product [Adineta steineri]CAF1044202.1 unnamed protein product [Adineta steineri]
MLVFGRAGIGKSTFCRYVAYQWATGIIWSEYELVILLPLRSLTANHYPPGITYSLIDIVEKEYFSCPSLSEKDKSFLQQQFNKSRILWLLDGYDEIVQNIPAHLQRLLEQLCKAPHHIITSRPYMNSLSYPMHMEITGFTDENIPNYINQFFGEVENGSHYSYTEHNGVLSFLKRNPRIWGIAHIPINLELICSVWSNTNWSTTKRMTMTTLYDNLIEWICRRYLEKQQGTPIEKINLMSKKCVYENCRNELAFLESLAFHAMENNTILLDPKLLEEAEKETNCYLDEHKNLLNIGILKSFTQSGVGTRIEVVRDHHFVHLSFQEYFAAGYLVDALRHNHNKKGIEFIKHQKYNQWFRLVFMFTSGLLHESRDNKSIDIFWNAAIGKPLDLVGIRHMDFVISCFDQADVNQTFACYDRLMHSIIRWIERAFRIKQDILRQALLRTFRLCTTILNQPPIQTTLLKLLKNEQTTNITEMLSFISNIQISNPMPALIDKVLLRLKHSDYHIRCSACEALRAMGTKAPTTEIIRGLLGAFKDENFYVRISAFDVLREMGEEPASSEVMNGLIGALKHDNSDVRSSACDALCAMGEKAATSEVISELLGALKDENSDVRSSACDALRAMGEKVATSEVISGLLGARKDEEFYFRSSACDALCAISEKAASTEVISELLSALKDANSDVRNSACKALRAMCKKAASIEVINGLLSALKDEDSYVICSACKALGAMGEKAALNEVISELLSVFKDGDYYVRRSVCDALRAMSENATSKATISTLLVALKEKDSDVKISACDVLRKMDQKAVSSEEISELLSALKDQNSDLRNSACDTLGAIGEKAATSEVICELLCALRDGDSYLRNSACYTLGAMAEKLATSEVISQVMTILVDVWEMSRINTRDESQGFLSLLSAIAVFCDKKDVVVDAAGPFKRCFETNLISAQRLLKVYMDTADPRWLPAVVGAFLVTQNAVTVVGNTLLVYEEQVVVEIPFTQHNLVDKLHKVFDKQSLKIDYKVRRCCSLL